jgi:myo-inositol catabolism protein IolC
MAEKEMATQNLARSETEDEKWEKLTIMIVAHRIQAKSLVLLQVNCSIYNKTLDFWNSVDTHNADVVIGTESRQREEI